MISQKNINAVDSIRVSIINIAKDLPVDEPLRQGVTDPAIQVPIRMPRLNPAVIDLLSTPQKTHYPHR